MLMAAALIWRREAAGAARVRVMRARACVVTAAIAILWVFSTGAVLGAGPVEPPPPNGPAPIADDLESRATTLLKIVQSKGGLGIYPGNDGGIVAVVPRSGSSTFRLSDATSLGLSVSIQSADMEPSEVDELRTLAAAQNATAFFDLRSGKVVVATSRPDVSSLMTQRFPGRVVLLGSDPVFASRQTDYNAIGAGQPWTTVSKPAAAVSAYSPRATPKGWLRLGTASSTRTSSTRRTATHSGTSPAGQRI